MKKTLAFLNYCFVALAVSVSAQEYRVVQDGIEHAKMTRKIKDEPIVVNLLRVDLSKVRLDVVHAMDAAIGTETTSSMATRHGAMAAINAGFFRLDKSIFVGDAAGVLMIDGNLLSESVNDRVGLLIRNDEKQTMVSIAHLNLYYNLTIWGKKDKIEHGKKVVISGINRERKNDEIILYTPEFHRTTLTNSSGIEVIIDGKKRFKILDGKGNNIIPTNGYILSAAGNKRKEVLETFNANSTIALSLPVSVVNVEGKEQESVLVARSNIEDIIGGVPQLIKNGKIEITWQQEKSSKAFVETRHPRTAVAKLKDGKFLLVTVDGRQPGVSVGMNLNELAEMLLELGATDAMNLDGGGSTTMFLGGKIVNQPSDKEGERKVSDAILVSPRKKN